MTITITDKKNGDVGVRVVASPPLEKDAKLTPAQSIAFVAMSAMSNHADKTTVVRKK